MKLVKVLMVLTVVILILISVIAIINQNSQPKQASSNDKTYTKTETPQTTRNINSIESFCKEHNFDDYVLNSITRLDYIVYNNSSIAKVLSVGNNFSISKIILYSAIANINLIEISPSFATILRITDLAGENIEFILDPVSARKVYTAVTNNLTVRA